MPKYIVAALLLAVSPAAGNAQAVAQDRSYEASAAKKVKPAPCKSKPANQGQVPIHAGGARRKGREVAE